MESRKITKRVRIASRGHKPGEGERKMNMTENLQRSENGIIFDKVGIPNYSQATNISLWGARCEKYMRKITGGGIEIYAVCPDCGQRTVQKIFVSMGPGFSEYESKGDGEPFEYCEKCKKEIRYGC